MATTFGTRPEDTVADSRGNVLSGVVLELYPTEADANAKTSFITSVSSNASGLWPYSDASGRSLLWVRDPNGNVWPVGAEDALGQVANKADKSYVDTGLNGKVAKGDLVVNVKDHGAVGDGVTDDSAAFTSAVAAGNVIYVPQGNFVVSGLVLTAGKKLYGAGVGVTRLIHNADNDCIAATGTSGAPLTGISVTDLSIVADAGNANQRGIYFQYVNSSTVRDVSIEACGNNGLNWYYSKAGTIRNVEVSTSKNFGILIYQSSRMLVTGCYVHDITLASTGHLGIQFKASQYCQAINNRIDNVAGYGIYTFGDGTLADVGHIISGNTITGCATTTGGTGFVGIGIHINTSDAVRITDNVVVDSDSDGIVLTISTSSLVSGNRLSGKSTGASTPTGVSLTSTAKYAVVTGNHITGSENGVYVNGASYCTVSNNIITNLYPSASNLAAGVRLRNSSTFNRVIGNVVIDDLATHTTKRGVYEESGSNNVFMHNHAQGTTQGDFAVTSTVAFGNTAGASATPTAKQANPGTAAGTDAAVINSLITAVRNLGGVI